MKEERSKEKLKEVYEKPIWNELRDQIDDLAKSFLKKRNRDQRRQMKMRQLRKKKRCS